MSVADARERYLKIIGPYNAALEKFESAAHAGRSWTDLRTLAGEVVDTNAAQAGALRAVDWPERVREPMAALLEETDAAQRYWSSAARATSADALASAVRSAAAHSGTKQANEVRSGLGLPPYAES